MLICDGGCDGCDAFENRWIKHCDIFSFCSDSQLLELKELNVAENRLPDLACLSSLYCLQTLLIPLNLLQSVGPLGDDAFLRLAFLDASYNYLDASALPALGELPSLTHLDLSGNDLGALPDDCGGFPQLKQLVVANCSLDAQALLPLSGLTCLEELYMVSRHEPSEWALVVFR